MNLQKQSDFGRILMTKDGLDQGVKDKQLSIPSGEGKLRELVAALDDFPTMFSIITRELGEKPASGSRMGSIQRSEKNMNALVEKQSETALPTSTR